MQMIEFLDTTLHWARPNFTKVHSTRKKTELKIITEKLLNLYQYPIESKRLTIHQEIHHDAILLSDPEVVSIVLRNLISNAIKYTPTGGIINISHAENAGRHVISIANSGSGISKEKINQILQKNYSSEPGTQGEKGLGLGLKLSQQFLQSMGGWLEIESNTNLTSFKLILPGPTEDEVLTLLDARESK